MSGWLPKFSDFASCKKSAHNKSRRHIDNLGARLKPQRVVQKQSQKQQLSNVIVLLNNPFMPSSQRLKQIGK